ncbi:MULTISPECIES: chemotaxis protein CheW [Xanthomonas]|uniref:Chemotaxis protein CheW n=2 Tax=Xanthomonas TaxID=338 RepID=A0A2P5Z344_9XANT|nr:MULTISPECIES: chemotaxis protein CheW [Xanthomonas]MBO9827535.1 purine-binding chemotaxis protein CheW [Xanthomonas sp. A2111]MBO9872440.1 purine-binding chemotaxis protein CheW [Xanthomonas sp. D-93]MBO9879791.1 purine-binding chemotaxis protein CheW [Xanthomonas sp. D-109]MDS9994374.1 chemotaxis protein CheW [Xanthomonas sp. A2111]MDV0438829.1 chemotaxis protein CheW [Xanthomonas sacchari]
MRSPFDILEAYERRSLAHAVQMPERAFDDDVWRGVGYRVGTRHLVSDFREVVEIVRMPPVTPVPGAQPWLLGVGNLRGNLFPVVDLKQFLEGERTALQEGQRVLIMRQSGGDVALTIDELFGQRSFTEAQAVEPGDLAQGRYAHFIDRAFRGDAQDWGVFSLSLLSRTPEFRQAAA